MKVYYLGDLSDFDSVYTDRDFKEKIKAHRDTVIYEDLKEFEDAFNDNEISDLGYILIDHEGEGY